MTGTPAGVARWQWGVLAVALAALVAAFLASGSSTARIATVDGRPVSLTSYRHWLLAAAASVHERDSALPPFPPDAPDYSRCVAYERAAVRKGGSTPPRDATLRGDCRQLGISLAESVVELLISARWILDQGAREHVTVTTAEVRASLHSSFPRAGGLMRFLASNRLSRDELEFEVRADLTGRRLSRLHAGPAPAISAEQIAAYYQQNRAQVGNETLAQATPAIRQILIAEAQALKVEPYLARVQQYWLRSTSCVRGYRIANYCHGS